MEVILIQKSAGTGSRTHLARTFLIPSVFISLITIASLSNSAYQHYSSQRTAVQKTHLSTTSARKQRDSREMALRLEQLKTQAEELEKRGRRLAKKSTREVDFSLSWERMIAKKTATRQARSSARPQKNRKKPWASTSHTFTSHHAIKIKHASTEISEQRILEEYRYQVQTLPTGWPLKQGRISSKFGWRGKRQHKGLDIAAASGTPIHAVEDGEVVRAKYVRGYGNLVEIKHSDIYTTRYAHNQKNLVKPGDYVKKGQIIAFVGSTGRSTGPHVHFEIRQNNVAINPILYLGALAQFTLADNRIKLTQKIKLSKK
jgi:murein DD-endopeptidase MepM/ murein hydrolase activator NlpD